MERTTTCAITVEVFRLQDLALLNIENLLVRRLSLWRRRWGLCFVLSYAFAGWGWWKLLVQFLTDLVVRIVRDVHVRSRLSASFCLFWKLAIHVCFWKTTCASHVATVRRAGWQKIKLPPTRKPLSILSSIIMLYELGIEKLQTKLDDRQWVNELMTDHPLLLLLQERERVFEMLRCEPCNKNDRE